jgi:hypothetical protein
MRFGSTTARSEALFEKVENSSILVRITQVRSRGAKLRGDEGINLPESNPSPSGHDIKRLENLPFVVEHADVVEISFANTKWHSFLRGPAYLYFVLFALVSVVPQVRIPYKTY